MFFLFVCFLQWANGTLYSAIFSCSWQKSKLLYSHILSFIMSRPVFCCRGGHRMAPAAGCPSSLGCTVCCPEMHDTQNSKYQGPGIYNTQSVGVVDKTIRKQILSGMCFYGDSVCLNLKRPVSVL